MMLKPHHIRQIDANSKRYTYWEKVLGTENLKSRAIRVGYINPITKIPANSDNPNNIGKARNWLNNLIQLEKDIQDKYLAEHKPVQGELSQEDKELLLEKFK